MRSKGNEVESPPNGVLVPHAIHEISKEEEGDVKLQVNKKIIKDKVHLKDEENLMTETENTSTGSIRLKDLSKDDLLKLLGIMEGEVQARENVIQVLKSGLSRPELLESRYGSALPTKPLKALQRDALLIKHNTHQDDVYEKPMAELDRLQDKHKETYRRMLEQLLLAEKCHRRVVHELDVEKRKHVDYMNKSDDFTNLLEQERERLKLLLKQEKSYQTRKDNEHFKRLEKVRGELVKLKSFALMLVDEQQLHLDQIDQQSQKIQELLQRLEEKDQTLSEVDGKAKEDKQKLLHLEGDLKVRSLKFAQQYDEMAAKLASQESQNRQMCQTEIALLQKTKELEETNAVLQKSAEELQELRDKISKGQCGNSNLMAELENLHKKVLEMEGKDEEISKTEKQCNELKNNLQTEEKHNKDLKLEVEQLQKRITELEKLEEAFNIGRTECSQLQCALDKEKNLTKEIADELVAVKIRMKEVETSELKLGKAELVLKEEVMKLKSVTAIMVNERKNLAERIRSEEKKREEVEKLFKAEQEKVMEVTERLIEESKRLLKFKSEMEAKVSTLVKEKEELKVKLTTEEEKCKDLNSKISLIKQTNDAVKDEGKESPNKVLNLEVTRLSNCSIKDQNKISELTMEIERLRNRLKQLEVVEGDLLKTEDEYDMLEKRFKNEQEKAKSLSQQVEEMRSEIALNMVKEKEAFSKEAELWRRCRLEETKNKDLQADVQALKEKIHELMNKEDQLSQLQVNYSVLQQKFHEEEDQKKNMSNEVINLTKELEITKRYSRALRPSNNGRRIMDVPMMSTGVQTDTGATETSDDDTPAVFIKKSVQEENQIMSTLRQRSLKKPSARPTVRELYPPPPSDLALKKSCIPWIKKKDSHTQSSLEKSVSINGDTTHSEIKITPKQGQPFHIRVTPDHQNSKTTLQISSTSLEIFNSTIPTPSQGLQKPQITIIPTTVVSPKEKSKDPKGPERAKSPITITAISRARSPESIKSPSIERPTSPVTLSVNTSFMADMSGSPESQEMITGRAVFKLTPEKRMVPTPIKKCNSNANLITTEDNKIHIHLGQQFKKSCENSSSVVMVKPAAAATESKELSTGTVLRSPHHGTINKAVSSKVTSSLTITQVATAPPRPTLYVQPVLDPQTPRSGLTRIPMSRGMKTGKAVLGSLGTANGVRLESKPESQSMRIELKKPSVSSATLHNGGKN
ncbi:filamin-A-interacting protein 1 [Trichomycterus rosablanca]|uniref:filamin-A-interacting protein 1 n=1 Tax=Trichomycterus rosablanca TaxID=2290929 RepID=UPI002F354F4A